MSVSTHSSRQLRRRPGASEGSRIPPGRVVQRPRTPEQPTKREQSSETIGQRADSGWLVKTKRDAIRRVKNIPETYSNVSLGTRPLPRQFDSAPVAEVRPLLSETKRDELKAAPAVGHPARSPLATRDEDQEAVAAWK